MKNIFALFLVLNFSSHAQSIVYYVFNSSYGDTVPDISGNGNDGILFGGAYIKGSTYLRVGFKDSDYMSVPPEAINGLSDFTIRIKARIVHKPATEDSIFSLFSISNESCINCCGLSYNTSNDYWILSFNGITYHPATTFTYETKILRHDDTLWWLSPYCGTCKDTFFIVGNNPLDVSSFVIGQKEQCPGGCFYENQGWHGGLNNLEIWDYPDFKESEELDNKESSSLSLFPNPTSTSFQLNYSITASSPLIITDAVGRVVKQLMLDASSDHITISTNDLADGVYLVVLNDGEKRISKKLIVAK